MTPEEVRQEVQDSVAWHDIGELIDFAFAQLLRTGQITPAEAQSLRRRMDWQIVLLEDGDA